MRENRTSGSVQGAPGNRRSYCKTLIVNLQSGVKYGRRLAIAFDIDRQVEVIAHRQAVSGDGYAVNGLFDHDIRIRHQRAVGVLGDIHPAFAGSQRRGSFRLLVPVEQVDHRGHRRAHFVFDVFQGKRWRNSGGRRGRRSPHRWRASRGREKRGRRHVVSIAGGKHEQGQSERNCSASICPGTRCNTCRYDSLAACLSPSQCWARA